LAACVRTPDDYNEDSSSPLVIAHENDDYDDDNDGFDTWVE
jgi:hypothetical protein